MKQLAKYSIAAFSTALIMALAPNTASAGGSLHLDLPGISIGVYDDHRYRYKRKYRHSKRYGHRYNDGYYRDRGYYRERRRARRSERRQRYSNDYYYGGRDRYYDRPRRAERCPAYGYSRYYVRDRGCYKHKDHYHCSD